MDMTNREDVRQFFYRAHEPVDGVDPGWTGSVASCTPGTLSSDYLNATLARVNYFRAMAGVPNVTLDPTKDAGAQAAALIMAAEGAVNHFPPSTWPCWTQTGSNYAVSNLDLNSGGISGVEDFMDDFGVPSVGHRDALLYEGTGSMGFGEVPAVGDDASALYWEGLSQPATERDGFVAWPPKGFVPYQVVYPDWSFALPGGDFTNATVTMTHNSTNVPVTVNYRSTASQEGQQPDPNIVWTLNQPIGGNPGSDATYTVTVSNIGNAAQSSFTYNVTIIDPVHGDPAHTPTGPTSPKVGVGSTYTVPAISSASGYQWRDTPLVSNFVDGAESGAGNWSLSCLSPCTQPATYNPVESTDVASGVNAFQLWLPFSYNAYALTLNNAVLPNANSVLNFDSKFVNFGDFDAEVQASTDGGATWDPALQTYNQPGNQSSFSNKSVSLAQYAGERITLRFLVYYSYDNANPCDCANQAWHFDNVSFSNTNVWGTSTLSGVLGSPSDALTLPSAGQYAIDVRPSYADTGLGLFSAPLYVTATCTTNCAPTLTSVSVTPATPSIGAGQTAQMQATATYSDSTTKDVTSSATWSSSNPSVATVSSSGLVTGVADGTSTIQAAYGGITGSTTVTVFPVVTSLSVTPANPSITLGGALQMVATARFSDGSSQDVTQDAFWSSNSAAAFVFPMFPNAGLVISEAPGIATIQADYGGVTGSTTVTVLPVLTSVSVTPANPSIGAGQTLQMHATATYSDSTTKDVTSSATWSSTNPSVATVTTSGLVAGVAPGGTGILAKYGGVTGGTGVGIIPPVQDSSRLVTYDSWQGVLSSAASGGSYRSTTQALAKASFSFSGTSVSWLTRKGPDEGKATVTIDGHAKGTFDLYSSTAQAQAHLNFTGLTSGTHTIVVSATGTKNSSSSAAKVAVDAFVVGTTTTEETSNNVGWGAWTGTAASTASGGSYRSASTAGATASLAFNGRSISFVTATGPADGKAQVLIDGTLKATLDLYSATAQWKTMVSYTGLASGPHTITIKALGTKNSKSTGTKVVVDAFIVLS